jgi:branched-chain amino acid transport system permease protein
MLRVWIAATVVVASLALLPLIPYAGMSYVLNLLTLMFMYIVLAQSYDLVGGMLGYVNLGHIAFFALGAYGFGISFNAELGLALALFIGAAVAALFALLVSYPFFRLRGAYFSLATFGLIKLLEYLTNNLRWLTGGSNGLKIAAADRTLPMYGSVLALAVITVLVSWLVSRSRLGLAMKSIREDEAVARDFGVPTLRIKTQALVLSAVFPGILGGLYTWYFNFIDPPQVYGIKMALQPVAMAMLGGTGLVIGPVAGSVFLYVLEEIIWTQFEHLHGAMLGAVIVLVGLFIPGGLVRLPRVERLLERLGLREADQ